MINIVHLYPNEMNIYGDNGNVLILQKRMLWRGVASKVTKVGVGDSLPKDTHIIIGGGGQDAGQSLISDDLQRKAKSLRDMADGGIPMLMICGMYQMFGHYFKTATGETIPGIGIIDIFTTAGNKRLIGNIVSLSRWGRLIGYENHSGLTIIGENAEPLGRTKKGQGNNGKDLTEGAVYQNVFGTYLHGPILAKAPVFADHLVEITLSTAGIKQKCDKLNDDLENMAAKAALKLDR